MVRNRLVRRAAAAMIDRLKHITEPDFTDERERRTLTLQLLGRSRTSWPCKAKKDSCPLPGDWAILDSETGLMGLSCHEHIAEALWDIWHEPFIRGG